MYERILELCRRKGIAVSRLEIELDFSRASISKWTVSLPRCDKLKAVADYFGVSMEYLMTGEERDGLSENERMIISLFNSLDSERQLRIIGSMRDAAIAQKSEG